MKLSELKNWDQLTPEEQARLREVYGDDAEVTKTMRDTDPESLKKANEGGKNG